MDESLQVVLENISTSAEWRERSFVGDLEERGEWSYSEYWRLELALYCLAISAPERELYAAIFKVFVRLSQLISAHLDADDVFVIKHMTRVEVLSLQERVGLVFQGVFEGRMPERKQLFPRNPWLTD